MEDDKVKDIKPEGASGADVESTGSSGVEKALGTSVQEGVSEVEESVSKGVVDAIRSRKRGLRKVRVGVVLSNKMDKSVVVEISRKVKHPIYHKFIARRTRLMAHDAANVCRIGDRVEIMETRPLSKHKQWRLVKVLEKAE